MIFNKQNIASTEFRYSPVMLYLYSLLGIIALSMILVLGYILYQMFK